MLQAVADIIDDFVGGIRSVVVSLIKEAGSIAIFLTHSIKVSFEKPSRFGEMVKHMEFIGNQSVFIITLTGLFTGLALSFQIYLGFKLFNAVNMVGPTVALGITRELGPVLTGLIVAARAGGAMAARLGTMRVSEQIDALDVMGVNTKQYLITPRIFAATLCMPMLTAIFDFVAMLGSYFLCVKLLELDEAVFFDKVASILEPRHINEGLIKGTVFGITFSTICSFRGFNCTGGAKGVGEATNNGVVQSMVLIIILDYFITNLIRVYYNLMGIA